jgi:hypothetical protein
MTKKLNVLVASLVGFGSLAMFAVAVPVTSAQQTPDAQAAPQSQSITGTIAAFDKDSFTLNVGSTVAEGEKQQSSKTMSFTIDKNTTIDGKMRVGATADVTYRESNGQNVAVSVRVAQ